MVKSQNSHELFSNLPRGVLDRFLEAISEIRVSRGGIIYEANGVPQGIYFVRSGVIGLIIDGQAGSEHLARFRRAADFFGHRSFLAREPYHARAVALTESVVEFIPEAAVEWALDSSSEFRSLVIQRLVDELEFVELHSLNLGENEILERVACAVIYFKQVDPEVDWTSKEIADFCVSPVPTVTKMLSRLEKLGFIKQTGATIHVSTDALSEALEFGSLGEPTEVSDGQN